MTALLKYNNEVRKFSFNFGLQPEITGGATVASAVVTATPTGLTIGSPTVNSPIVSFNLSAGTIGLVYDVQCLATLNTGAVLNGCGQLQILEC